MTKARGVRVERIETREAKPFILGVHYARRMPSVSYAYGMYEGERLIGIVTYGQPASPFLCIGVAGKENRQRVLELNRLCFLPGEGKKNYASTLVGRSLKLLPTGSIVVSYADVGGWSHVGYVYQATNFLFTGKTKRRTDIYSESGHARHHCGDTSRRQVRTEKYRYVYITGKGAVKRKLMSALRYPVMPYPKGDERRYDESAPVPIDSELLLDAMKGERK